INMRAAFLEIADDPSTQGTVALGGAVLQGNVRRGCQHAGIRGADLFSGKAQMGGQAAGKGRDIWAFGDFENFTDRGAGQLGSTLGKLIGTSVHRDAGIVSV